MADRRYSIKIKDLCKEYGLSQLISESTHYTETSQSTIDLILTNNNNDILTSRVGEPFLDQNIHYHCPVFCVLDFQKPNIRSFKRHIWLFGRGNYQALSTELNNTYWDNLKDIGIKRYTNNVTSEHIIKCTSKYIPNKSINARPSDPSWFTTIIKKLIRKRKPFYTKYKKTRANSDHEAYRKSEIM